MVLSNIKNEVIVLNYTGRKGGGAIVAFESAKALIESGQAVVAIVSKQIENIEMWRKLNFKELVEIDTYDSKMSFVINTVLFPFFQKKIIRKIKNKYKVKAVYCPMVSFWTKAINDIFRDVKIITVNHDPIPHSGTSKVVAWLMERPYKSADVVVVHTKKFVEYTSKKYGKTVYFPLPRHCTYRDIKEKKCLLSYDDKKINFLFFGRITEYKGLDILAHAYSNVSKQYGDKVSLNVVGYGDFSKYELLYRDLDNVKIINKWVEDEEVESVFAGENIVLICPYKDATQSGVVLVAYDYGVPVIASNIGGISEQVIDGKTGILVEPNSVDDLVNAMNKLIENHVIISMRDNIKSYLHEISWDKTVRKIIDIIENEEK